ncbi:MAG: sigma-70 family RNA polymerase sigma factor [Acidimicrobiales bacterium]|nr:sigma-70 family RNA polymerase sigma factor [Acidimicrobiales bacterium]
MSAEDFQTILSAAQAGADWAVTALYRAHNPRVLRYLRAQEPADCADVASDTWLDAARNLRTFTGTEDDFAGWLFTITRRRLTDHRRAKHRRLSDPAPDAAFATLSSVSAETMAFTGTLGDEEARRMVEFLPHDQAEIVLLRIVAGLDVDTVARLTGRRPGTVRVMQHRALKRLAKELDRDRNERKEASDGTQRDVQAPGPPR